MLTFEQFLQENPQYYKGTHSYQKDTKFIPISRNNIQRYEVLGSAGNLQFMLDPSGSVGYVFDDLDLKSKLHHISPIMHVHLRDSGYKNLPQAHHLRIKKNYAQQGVATLWYKLYVNNKGPIVSDTQHLEGGKNLWKSFLMHPEEGIEISILNLDTQQVTPVTSSDNFDELEKQIWSEDESKRNIVMLMQKK